MKEELKIIQKDIEDLEQRLKILRDREIEIKDKMEAAADDLAGKYISVSIDDLFDAYMKVDRVVKSFVFGCNIAVAYGHKITIDKAQTTCVLNSDDMLSISSGFNVIKKSEYEEVLKKALDGFWN